MTNPVFYTTQSVASEPGVLSAWLDDVPADVAAIQRVSRQLVFHYRAHGDIAEHGFPRSRLSEIDLHDAAAMFGRIRELDTSALTADRPPLQRMVGCCRDHTLFFLAMARHKGIPARMRVGYATYFVPGWYLDHVVAEVWDAAESRWRLVEAEIGEDFDDPTDNASLDVLDMPRERFVVAPRAWLACRAGEADPERFVVSPELEIPLTRSWPYLVHNVLHDLAALGKQEMVLWDTWGLADRTEPLDAPDLAALDDTAQVMMTPSSTPTQLGALLDRDGFRVPPVFASYSPASDVPLEILLPR